MTSDDQTDNVTIYGSAGEILDENALSQLLTPASRAKLITAMLVLEGDADSPSNIVERAGLGRNSWYDNRDVLLSAREADPDSDGPHFGIIEQDGHVGNSPMYRARMEDPLVQALDEVFEIARVRAKETAED